MNSSALYKKPLNDQQLNWQQRKGFAKSYIA
jgi:hypothetical protein